MHSFPCTQCGLCCQQVHQALETRFLDRGDGTCKHYDNALRQCLIYDTRPEICRVDRQYILHYSKNMSWDAFVEANLNVCHQLQQAAIKAS